MPQPALFSLAMSNVGLLLPSCCHQPIPLGASAMPILQPVSHHDHDPARSVSLVQTWTPEIESGFNGYCALAHNALARVRQVLDHLSYALR